jgi:hypothetical protein
LQTLTRLRGIIATLLAPYVIMDEPASGQDKACLERWQTYWWGAQGCTDPCGPDFAILCEQATTDVIDWLWTPGCREQISVVTETLLKQGTLTGAELQALVQRFPLDGWRYYRGSYEVALRSRCVVA